MTRVAFLLPELEAGGAQRVMLMLAREFTVRGHRVDLVLMCAKGALLTEIPDGVRLVDLGARSYGVGQLGFTVSCVRRLARWMKQERPDVLLSTITGSNLVALIARKLTGVSLRVLIREAVTLKNVGSDLRLRAMRWLYPQADAIVALSPFMKEELVSKIGVTPDRISCIANPVDVFFIREQAKIPIDHPWLNDDQIQVMVAVGRLIPQKDFMALLRSFALLPQKSPVRLIIVGEGPERPVLEKFAADLGIAKRVALVGYDANPWRWMKQADLFVLSSQWEGHPNVLLEAMVLGKPVVVTRYDISVYDVFSMIPECPHVVVDVGDVNALAEACQNLIGKQGCDAYVFNEVMLLKSVDAYEEVMLKQVVMP